jgi:hypothetical protein
MIMPPPSPVTGPPSETARRPPFKAGDEHVGGVALRHPEFRKGSRGRKVSDWRRARSVKGGAADDGIARLWL